MKAIKQPQKRKSLSLFCLWLVQGRYNTCINTTNTLIVRSWRCPIGAIIHSLNGMWTWGEAKYSYRRFYLISSPSSKLCASSRQLGPDMCTLPHKVTKYRYSLLARKGTKYVTHYRIPESDALCYLKSNKLRFSLLWRQNTQLLFFRGLTFFFR